MTVKLVHSGSPKDAAPAPTVKIVMSDREPVLIVEADWPIVAYLMPSVGFEMFIRQHLKTNRRLIYGWNSKNRFSEGTQYAGYELKAGEDAAHTVRLLVIELGGLHGTYPSQLLMQLPGKALR